MITSEDFHFLELLVSTIFLQTVVRCDFYIFFLLEFSSLLRCVVSALDEHCLAVYSASSGCGGLSGGGAYREEVGVITVNGK